MFSSGLLKTVDVMEAEELVRHFSVCLYNVC